MFDIEKDKAKQKQYNTIKNEVKNEYLVKMK